MKRKSLSRSFSPLFLKEKFTCDWYVGVKVYANNKYTKSKRLGCKNINRHNNVNRRQIIFLQGLVGKICSLHPRCCYYLGNKGLQSAQKITILISVSKQV